jgi:hypothetical protein
VNGNRETGIIVISLISELMWRLHVTKQVPVLLGVTCSSHKMSNRWIFFFFGGGGPGISTQG